jgi:hypothetical protein
MAHSAYKLLTRRPCRLHSGTVAVDQVLTTWSLSLAAELVRRGLAEPNDAFTAEAIELALRLRLIARQQAIRSGSNGLPIQSESSGRPDFERVPGGGT